MGHGCGAASDIVNSVIVSEAAANHVTVTDIVNSVIVSESAANHVTVTSAAFINETGASFFYGAESPPLSTVGVEGGFYIDVISGKLWGPKGSTDWPNEPVNFVPRRYVHNQNTPSSSWEIVHDLSGFPSVTVVDSANNVVIGDVEYLDQSTINISFSGAFSGKAYLT